MKKKNENARTLFCVIAASVLVVASITLVSLLGGDLRRGGIVLPEKGQSAAPPNDNLSEAGFVTLSTDNVPEVVRTLARPACYHQTLLASVPAGDSSAETSVDLWVRENVWKIVRRDSSGTRCILTDGRRAYLWYTDDPSAMSSLTLPEGVSRDELAGVVTYETIAVTPPEQIQKADYEPLSADSEVYCLAVQTQSGDAVSFYQIDLTTGLLLSAELQRDGEKTYSLHQTALELLSADDAALLNEMKIPVGTPDFSEETETRRG